MILQLGVPQDSLEFAHSLLPAEGARRRLDDAYRLDLLLLRATGLFVGPQWRPSSGLAEELRAIRRRHPWLTIVVGGPSTMLGAGDQSRELQSAGADAIVRWDAPESAAPQIVRLWYRAPLLRAATAIECTSHLPQPVRELMVASLRLPSPPSDVAALAALAHVHRASLWKIWRRAERDIPTAGTYLDWLQLLQVVLRKDQERSWRAASDDVGVRASSVARLSKRILGQPLSSFKDGVQRRLIHRFLQDVVGMTTREIRTFAPVACQTVEEFPPTIIPIVAPVKHASAALSRRAM